MSNTVVDTLEELLTKAKAGEISSLLFVAVRDKVDAGGIAYYGAIGDEKDNPKWLDSIRCIWQSGFQQWKWPPLGVDQNKIPFKLGRRG